MKPFAYSKKPRARKHGPRGYTNYIDYKPWLRDEFKFCCVYCLDRERWRSRSHHEFEVDHRKPNTKKVKRLNRYSNLVYSCHRCNQLKNDDEIHDPCEAPFGDHLRVRKNGTIVGKTPIGKAIIKLLHLEECDRYRCDKINDHARFLILRSTPNRNASEEVEYARFVRDFGFPDDMPDLEDGIKPPRSNSKRSAALRSHYYYGLADLLPDIY